MTAQISKLDRAKNINKPKALSALSVGGVSYYTVMNLVSQWLGESSLADSWLNSSAAHHWIGIAVAAVMSGIAAWRTSSAPTARQERKADVKTAAKLDEYRQLKALDENGDDH